MAVNLHAVNTAEEGILVNPGGRNLSCPPEEEDSVLLGCRGSSFGEDNRLVALEEENSLAAAAGTGPDSDSGCCWGDSCKKT